MPVYPSTISTTDAIMMAAAIFWIWSCQSGRSPLAPWAAVMPIMANVGPRKEMVPPWITGSLLPNGDCWIRVQSPDVKNMVEINNAS